MPEKEKILARTRELYMKFGVKSVTMEDIARELGMSKKTLYQYFNDKDELVEKVMAFHLEAECAMVNSLQENKANAIDTMLNLANFLAENFKNLNPSCVYDLQKYYPDCWLMFRRHKQDFIYNIINNNIGQGIREGLYRNDLNIDVIARFYIGRVEMIADNEIFPSSRYSVPVILKEYINYHLRSICSEKGLKYLDKINKRQKVTA